jgi:NAD(P)-dependent dehydrogenase (short-subunit alcohol dehydrogenase family)
MTSRLNGRVVIVTGAARGIGRAAAVALAGAGADIAGPDICAVVDPALRDAAARVAQDFGGIDILFANAGIQALQSLLEMDDSNWHTQIDVNLTGTANAIRAIAPHLVSSRRRPHRGGRRCSGRRVSRVRRSANDLGRDVRRDSG